MSFSTEEIRILHKAGSELLPLAKSFSKNVCRLDPVTAEQVMEEAIENVLLYKKGRLHEIENLSAYLFTVFRHTLLTWVKKREREISLSDDEVELATSDYQEIEKKILLSEIISLMNEEEKFIYKNLTFGYSYDEISENYNRKFQKNFSANVLRSKFSKAIKRISRKLV